MHSTFTSDKNSLIIISNIDLERMAMIDDGDKIKIDLYKQQIDRLNAWSQFYHEAEIKVNASSAVLSVIAVIAGGLDGKSKFCFKVFGGDVNLVGSLLVLSSVVALVSTLGYWRYYEFSDFYAKKIRNRVFEIAGEEASFAKLKDGLSGGFKSKYPILGMNVFINVHHATWIFVQIVIFFAGLTFLLQKPT